MKVLILAMLVLISGLACGERTRDSSGLRRRGDSDGAQKKQTKGYVRLC